MKILRFEKAGKISWGVLDLGSGEICETGGRPLDARAKGFDTFAPIGPWIETELDPSTLRVRCLVNGEIRQDGNTREMGASVYRLVEFISHIMTLFPGDVIATGTPPGVGPVKVGDVMTIEVEGIGSLNNRVVAP